MPPNPLNVIVAPGGMSVAGDVHLNQYAVPTGGGDTPPQSFPHRYMVVSAGMVAVGTSASWPPNAGVDVEYGRNAAACS